MIQVSGTVVDATTGDAIPWATIAVNGKAVGSADSNGNFSVSLNTYDDTITASDVGYAPLTLPAYQVQESGTMQLGINADSLAAATVTATVKKPNATPWLVLAGIVVVASSGKSHSATMGGKTSNLVIPVALLGLGAYFLLKPSHSPVVSPTAPYAPVTPGSPITSPGASILNNTGLSSLANLFKGLLGGSSSPGASSFAPVGVQPIPGTTTPSSPAGDYTSLPTTAPTIPIDPGAYSSGGDTSGDPNSWDYGMAGIGGTTTINAGDVLGKTLIAAKQVPVYDEPNDSAQPSGYISKGNPIGIVYSYLNPDTSQGRAELWWMFEPLPGNTDIGDSLGYYYTPHNPDYFDTQALLDAGALTVAQKTALQNGTGPSTIDTLVKKYLPYVLGAVVAVGIGKAVINKAL